MLPLTTILIVWVVYWHASNLDIHQSEQHMLSDIDLIKYDLDLIKNDIYDACRFNCSQITKEEESTEYGAHHFQLNDKYIRFRVAKITPTKAGQFVTIWKRVNNGPIQPYDATDPVDFFVISTRKGEQFGQFVFPKTVLIKHNVISNNHKGGKRAIRVYPPWENNLNQQAKKSQKWQIEYFLDMSIINNIDYNRIKMLYSII